MVPDAERRFVEVALQRGLLTTPTVQALMARQGQIATAGYQPPSLPQMAVEAGALDHATAAKLVAECQQSPGTASAIGSGIMHPGTARPPTGRMTRPEAFMTQPSPAPGSVRALPASSAAPPPLPPSFPPPPPPRPAPPPLPRTSGAMSASSASDPGDRPASQSSSGLELETVAVRTDGSGGNLDIETIAVDRAELERSGSTLPASIGPYKIVSELGRGGMGIVYRARDRRLERDVALKTITGEPDEETRKRFIHESRALAQLRHPGIVGVYEAEQYHDKLVMALELVEGESLSARIARAGALPTRKAASMLKQLAEAVEAAHSAGVIHRDLKPANVLVDLSGRPRLTDFGLARSEMTSIVTQTGLVIGSPAYMAPEQALSEHGKVGPRTDVYGLGAVLYEALTAQPPFKGGTPVDVLRRVIDDEIEPPSKVRAREGLSPLPEQLENICMRALEKDMEKRYPSAAALSSDLSRFLAGERVTARRQSTQIKVQKWAGKHRGFVSGATVAVVLGVAGIIVILVVIGRMSDPVAEAHEKAVAAIADMNAAPDAASKLARARDAVKATISYDFITEGDAARHEDATRIRFDALMALGAAAADVKKWDEAEESYADAKALGVDDDRVQDALEALVARRDADEAPDPDDPPTGTPGGETEPPTVTPDPPVATDPPPDPVDPAVEHPTPPEPSGPRLNVAEINVAAMNAFHLRDFQRAKEIYDQGLQHHPDDTTLLHGRAQVREALKDYSGALEDLERLLARNDQHAGSWALKGVCLVRLARYADGVRACTRALELKQDQWTIWYQRAKVYVVMGDYEKAIPDYRQAIELNPTHAELCRQLGICYMEIGDNESAKGMLNRALGISRRETSYMQTWRVLQNLGDHDGAIRKLTEALSIKPEDPVHLFARGDAYRTRFETLEADGGGEVEDARRAIADYRQAVDNLLGEPYATEAKTQIERLRAKLRELGKD